MHPRRPGPESDRESASLVTRESEQAASVFDDGPTMETPFEPVAAGLSERASSPPPEAERASVPPAPQLEVEYVLETNPSATQLASWALLEIWTRNRIYQVDAAGRCMAVIDRITGKTDPRHSLIRAQLTGGERRLKRSTAVDVYFPYPMPGTEAVFRHDGKRASYGKTSTVERVVLRVRKTVVGTMDSSRSWDEITGRFSIPT
jgi:hypothetical protein